MPRATIKLAGFMKKKVGKVNPSRTTRNSSTFGRALIQVSLRLKMQEIELAP
jgi:hypothetical protein